MYTLLNTSEQNQVLRIINKRGADYILLIHCIERIVNEFNTFDDFEQLIEITLVRMSKLFSEEQMMQLIELILAVIRKRIYKRRQYDDLKLWAKKLKNIWSKLYDSSCTKIEHTEIFGEKLKQIVKDINYLSCNTQHLNQERWWDAPDGANIYFVKKKKNVMKNRLLCCFR